MNVVVDILLVAAGGALGALTRYVVSKLMPGTILPVGTLLVNIVGSFLLGFILYATRVAGIFSREERLLLATGFCGGLTTFSTFAYETFTLYTEGAVLYALANMALNLVLGLLAVYAGRSLALLIYGG